MRRRVQRGGSRETGWRVERVKEESREVEKCTERGRRIEREIEGGEE